MTTYPPPAWTCGSRGTLSAPTWWDLLVVPSAVGGVVTTHQADRSEGCPHVCRATEKKRCPIPAHHQPGTTALALAASSPPPEGAASSPFLMPRSALHNDLCEFTIFPPAGSYPPVRSSPTTEFGGCSLGRRKRTATAVRAATYFCKPWRLPLKPIF